MTKSEVRINDEIRMTNVEPERIFCPFRMGIRVARVRPSEQDYDDC
jgi:hypothetical protein